MCGSYTTGFISHSSADRKSRVRVPTQSGSREGSLLACRNWLLMSSPGGERTRALSGPFYKAPTPLWGLRPHDLITHLRSPIPNTIYHTKSLGFQHMSWRGTNIQSITPAYNAFNAFPLGLLKKMQAFPGGLWDLHLQPSLFLLTVPPTLSSTSHLQTHYLLPVGFEQNIASTEQRLNEP